MKNWGGEGALGRANRWNVSVKVAISLISIPIFRDRNVLIKASRHRAFDPHMAPQANSAGRRLETRLMLNLGSRHIVGTIARPRILSRETSTEPTSDLATHCTSMVEIVAPVTKKTP